MSIRARAPTRIDFAGGTTDLPSFRNRDGGAVVSAAIDRYAYCTLTASTDSAFRIVSQDLDSFVEARDIRDLEYDGNLDLLKAAIRRLELSEGVTVAVRCDAPPGSGIGSSASVGVALVGLINRLKLMRYGGKRECMSRFEIAELACKLESELGIVGGKQDQYAAAVGGFNYMQFFGRDRVIVEPLELQANVRLDLHKHLLLCYSGQSRLSGETNQDMISAYEAGDETVTAGLNDVKRIAGDVRRALIGGDMEWFVDLLEQEWQSRQKLAAGVVTAKLRKLREVGLDAGALAAKICGAGGGGCLVFYCRPDAEARVGRALTAAGGHILNFGFQFNGVEVWEAP